MAAPANQTGAIGDRSARRAPAALLRFLTAALVGGAVLLLWGGTAGAAASEDAPSAGADARLLGGLLGEGGALTPVVDLVDTTTGTLVGAEPVGETVDEVTSTVDPILAPVTTPVIQTADPVLAPVLDTVSGVGESVVDPVTTAIPPTIPGAPIGPTDPPPPGVPPTIDPTGPLLPELPPLLPPGPTAEPGASPGTGPTPAVGPSAAGPGAPAPLAVAAGITGRTGADVESSLVGAHGRTGQPTSSAASLASRGASATPSAGPTSPADGHRRSDLPVPLAADGQAPAACSGPGRGAPGASAVTGYLAAGAALRARTGAPIDVATSPPPAAAPPAGPEVAPD